MSTKSSQNKTNYSKNKETVKDVNSSSKVLKDPKTIILGTVSIIALAFLVVLGIIENNPKTSKIMKEFNKYYNSKNRVVIYYAKPTCSYCSLQTPILETIAKDYDIDYYYLDVSKLTSSENKIVMEKLEIEESVTPITTIVEKGKVIDSQVGYAEAESYLEFFKRNEMVDSDEVYSEEKYITKINYEQYEAMFSDGEEHVIVIGRTGCSHFTEFKPAINYVAEKYNITINYIDISTITEDESTNLINNLGSRGYDEESYASDGSFGTPTTLIVKNNYISGYFVGSKTISGLTKELEKAGIIK